MAKKDTTTTVEKKTRTILSPAERIAKAKAEVAALEQREADKSRKAMVALEEKSKALKARRDKIDEQIEALGIEHVELSKLLGDDGAGHTDNPSVEETETGVNEG